MIVRTAPVVIQQRGNVEVRPIVCKHQPAPRIVTKKIKKYSCPVVKRYFVEKFSKTELPCKTDETSISNTSGSSGGQKISNGNSDSSSSSVYHSGANGGQVLHNQISFSSSGTVYHPGANGNEVRIGFSSSGNRNINNQNNDFSGQFIERINAEDINSDSDSDSDSDSESDSIEFSNVGNTRSCTSEDNSYSSGASSSYSGASSSYSGSSSSSNTHSGYIIAD